MSKAMRVVNDGTFAHLEYREKDGFGGTRWVVHHAWLVRELPDIARAFLAALPPADREAVIRQAARETRPFPTEDELSMAIRQELDNAREECFCDKCVRQAVERGIRLAFEAALRGEEVAADA